MELSGCQLFTLVGFAAGGGQASNRDTVDVFVEAMQGLPGRVEAFLQNRRSAAAAAAASAARAAAAIASAPQLRQRFAELIQACARPSCAVVVLLPAGLHYSCSHGAGFKWQL